MANKLKKQAARQAQKQRQATRKAAMDNLLNTPLTGVPVIIGIAADVTRLPNGKSFTVHVQAVQLGTTLEASPAQKAVLRDRDNADQITMDVLRIALQNAEANKQVAKDKAAAAARGAEAQTTTVADAPRNSIILKP